MEAQGESLGLLVLYGLIFSREAFATSGKKRIFAPMKPFDDIRAVAFDADDTLWDCQSHFERVTDRYCQLLERWGNANDIREALFRTEQANMGLLGYGTKAFTLSLVENAVRMSHGEVTGDVVGEIVSMGRELLQLPATPLPEVEATLQRLYADGRYRLAVFTKGELLDQEAKLRRSGLARYFQHVEIVSDKTRHAFLDLCRTLKTAPRGMLMVGNSLKSDIAPALDIGASAIYIPFHVTWALEHTEAFEHERMVKISRFGEILNLI